MKYRLPPAALAGAVAMLVLAAATNARPPAPAPQAQQIIAQSVAANQRDWAADPEYSYTERDRTSSGSKTWKITMLFGSPYKQLIEVNGKLLSADQNREEQQKFDAAAAKRRAESASDRQSRIEDYEKGRRRDHLLMQQLSTAFDFRLKGAGTMNGHGVYILTATPKPGYQPPVMDARVLTGMRGTMWIDRQTSQWVKVRAQVISPVSIVGFLAKVDPGTWFELDKSPVADGVWLPSHFAMKSRATVAFMFHRNSSDDETYFDYHKTPAQYLSNSR